MVRITVLAYADQFGRQVEIDFQPPAGPYVRLTPQEWNQLLDEIDRVKREAADAHQAAGKRR